MMLSLYVRGKNPYSGIKNFLIFISLIRALTGLLEAILEVTWQRVKEQMMANRVQEMKIFHMLCSKC